MVHKTLDLSMFLLYKILSPNSMSTIVVQRVPSNNNGEFGGSYIRSLLFPRQCFMQDSDFTMKLISCSKSRWSSKKLKEMSTLIMKILFGSNILVSFGISI